MAGTAEARFQRLDKDRHIEPIGTVPFFLTIEMSANIPPSVGWHACD
jgi:hypothetical protein